MPSFHWRNGFNGFLLCAHREALFDRHPMMFNQAGDAACDVEAGRARLCVFDDDSWRF